MKRFQQFCRVAFWPVAFALVVIFGIVNISLSVVAHNTAQQQIVSLKATATAITQSILVDDTRYKTIIDRVDLGQYNLDNRQDVQRALQALSTSAILPPSTQTLTIYWYAKFDLCWAVAPCTSIFSDTHGLIESNCTKDYVNCVDISSEFPGDYSISPNDNGYASFKIAPHAAPITIVASIPIICSGPNACSAGYPDIDPSLFQP